MEPDDTPPLGADPDPEALLETVANEAASEQRAPDRAGPAWTEPQWALAALAAIAGIVLLIALAFTGTDDERTWPPDPCRGDEFACCVEDWQDEGGFFDCCDVAHDDRGLFDAEERFADDPEWARRC